MKGALDGKTLSLEATIGACGAGKFVLTRNLGEKHFLFGTYEIASGSVGDATVYLNPL